jgi:hypothetical protein
MKAEILVVLAGLALPAGASEPITCDALAAYLAAQRHVQQVTPATPLAALAGGTTTTPPNRCEANFIYSSRGGPRHGYAVGQDQRIVLRVGLPLNALDNGGTSLWNGSVQNLGGGGLVGNVGNVSGATNAGYVGSSTDSGHPASDNPNFAVIQETHELNEGRLDDFLNESIKQQYQWALRLAKEYYGRKASRNYWNGCSTGGRQGLALALRHAKDFDGFLTGAPANFHTRLQVATVWPAWVNKDVAGFTVTNAQMQAANASAIAACDAQDGLADGLLGDARECNYDARNNICGMPGAPASNCLLDEAQAEAVNRVWDGPRNDHGKRIWFPFGRGANASVLSNPPFGGPCGSLGIYCWSHRDVNFDWRPLPLAQFDDETRLATRIVAPHSDIISVELDQAKKSGAKILMWHGETDQLIPWRQSVHYYREAAQRFDGYRKLKPWFRFYVAPGVNHCGGGAGPQPQNLFGVLLDWVENGVEPDSILTQNATHGQRPMCPYPQTAIYDGGGDPRLVTSWRCGGNVETQENVCLDLVAKYQKETKNALDTRGLENPGMCRARHHHHEDDDDDD